VGHHNDSLVTLDHGAIAQIAQRLANVQRVLWITGAGLSADSGLPTYRGTGGLYDTSKTDDGISIEQALSAQTYATRPDLTWKYVSQVESACTDAVPNAAHQIIAQSQTRFESWVLTQNVDGLHRVAGSANVIDIHGDIHDLYCPRCTWRERVLSFLTLEKPPLCPQCGGWIRPDVVLFGELLAQDKMRTLARELACGFDAVLSIGTQSRFQYISQPVIDARAANALTVEINPDATSVSETVEFKLASGAAQTMTAIWQHLTQP
jgi:NAD-dependent deacetylase